MKKLAISLITCGLITAASAEKRIFTSADGSKTLKATPMDYSPKTGTATIKLETGRMLKVPVKSFKPEDKKFLDGWYEATQAGRKLAVSIKDEEDVSSERIVGTAKVKTINARYALNVRNNGDADLSDIEVKYKVFYTRDGIDGKKNESLTLDGTDTISRISAREDQRFMTEAAQLINQRPAPPSECKGGGWKAPKRASSRNDKLDGIIVKLMKDGKEIKQISYPSGLRRDWDS